MPEGVDYYKNISISTSRIPCFVFSAGCRLRKLPFNYLFYFPHK
jgi:hypothetical protein